MFAAVGVIFLDQIQVTIPEIYAFVCSHPLYMHVGGRLGDIAGNRHAS